MSPSPEEVRYNSDAIVDLLRALDVRFVAMNPGATYSGLHDSIVNYGGNRRPEIIQCCHEEIAVDIAHGYNLVAPRPMLAIVHNLIGLMHATMAIYNAWVDRAPVFILGATGPLAIEKRRPWIDWIHTAFDQGHLVRDYVKWDDTAATLQGAVNSIPKGYQVMMTEPKGPVYICLDADMQRESLTGPLRLPDVSRYSPPSAVQANPDDLEKVAELLVAAENPVVLADYLSLKPGAVDSLVDLADVLALPVIDGGRMFSFPNTHPMDMTGAREGLLRKADLVLCLDVFDLYQVLTKWDFLNLECEFVLPENVKIVDISLRHFAIKSWSQDYGKTQGVDLNVAGDTASAIPALCSICRRILAARPEVKGRLEERYAHLKAMHERLRKGWKEQADRARGGNVVSRPRLAAELWNAVKDHDYVLINNVRDSWARQLWTIDKPYQYIGGSMGGGIGYGIGRAIGAALAYRDLGRLCIDLQPDGDLLYTSSGLWTAAHHRIPLLIVMFNNRAYLNTKEHQIFEARRRGRTTERCDIGNCIEDPPVDFGKLAQAYGLYGEGPIDKAEDLQPALKKAVDYVVDKRLPALVDVVVQEAVEQQ